MNDSNKNLIPEISAPVRQYLTGALRAEELVRIVDDLVANDYLHGLDSRLVTIVERLHEVLALFVRDEPTRSEAPGVYVGDDELQERAGEFEQALARIASGRAEGVKLGKLHSGVKRRRQ